MSTGTKIESLSPARIVVGRPERVRRGKRTAFETTVAKPATVPQAARVALVLAFAHAIQRSIDSGEIRDQVEAAKQLRITRARVTQLLDLTLLDPRTQEKVLGMTERDIEPITERMLREVGRQESWRLP